MKIFRLFKLPTESRIRILLVGLISIIGFAAFSATNALAADGALDETYRAVFDAAVNAVIVQPDGKAVAFGDFSTYKGTARATVARINPDATLDTTLNPGTGFNGTVRTAVAQADGKFIVVGQFTTYNGTARVRVARINADGSLDTTFNPGAGANNTIYGVAVQSDGKIIIGGDFTSYNGTAINRLARLNADGTIDSSFNVGTGFDAGAFAVKVQSDGKIVIGGFFTFYNGAARTRIVRINLDGSLDATFNPGAGADGSVFSITIQTDGKIIIAGGFINFNNVSSPRIARLNANGSRDSAFNVGTGYNMLVRSTLLQPDGKVLVGCDCSAYNGTAFTGINRLNTNGTLDATFDSGSIINSAVLTIALQSDGKILIGGNFTHINSVGQNYERLYRLNGTAAATAAGVAIGGGVSTFDGRGIGKAKVVLTEANGVIHTATTNRAGYFHFDEIAAGQTCVITVQDRRYRFGEPTRVLFLAEDLDDIDFVALPSKSDWVFAAERF